MGFQYRTLAKAVRRRTASSISPPPQPPLVLSRSFAHLSSEFAGKRRSPPRRHFGIAFDIDGVIFRSESPIGGSPQALKRLYDEESGALRIPYVFLTNVGCMFLAVKWALMVLLTSNFSLIFQVLQGHTPFKNLVQRLENELVVAVGKGEPAAVLSEYGFKKVVSIDEYASCFPGIDPLAPYKNWEVKQVPKHNGVSEARTSTDNICSQRVQAVFVVSDSIDWSRDIQVLCDILRTGGLPGREIGHQPQLYFAHDDLAYQVSNVTFAGLRYQFSVQAAFPSERFGLGAFRIALESIFNRIHHDPLSYTCYGKPNPFVFKNAEAVLKQLVSSCTDSGLAPDNASTAVHNFERLYMVGDNPDVDIKGARQAGYPWFSILTRTGVFKGTGNHDKFPADLVVETVEEAVDYIIRKECS
ncbi:unnamed protein product [Linum tenue]|uniref:Hydrolase family protein / HAD-superfamily protein n=1 Tax=Linum tenue TaxID=586396 RepID=A0AAV0Q9X2_9ROSI|nr:unnamed protein product [Linum tenue]